MLSYNINPENKPVNAKLVQGESFYISESDDFDENEERTIFESNTSTTLDFLEIASNYQETQIYIQYYTGSEYESIGIVKNDGSGTTGMRIGFLVELGVSLFEVNSYNTASNAYKLSLSKPLTFPKG